LTDTRNSFALNAGSFLTRATPRANDFFERVIEYHQANATYEHQMSEQDCMRDIMFESSFLEDRFVMIPQHSINAFPEEIKCFDQRYKKGWEPGAFFIHFAGAWAHVKEEVSMRGTLNEMFSGDVHEVRCAYIFLGSIQRIDTHGQMHIPIHSYTRPNQQAAGPHWVFDEEVRTANHLRRTRSLSYYDQSTMSRFLTGIGRATRRAGLLLSLMH
jgi:hypothetical protein